MSDVTRITPMSMPAAFVLIGTLLLPTACDRQEGPSTVEVLEKTGSHYVVAPATEAASPLPSPEQAQLPDASAQAAATLTYRIIDAPGGTFGYDILSDGHLFIHQSNLPGQQGTDGCRTREQAETLAKLVIRKVKAGEMPPSVTAEELNELNIQ